MSAPTKIIAAGTRYCFAGFLDTNGFLLGSNTTAPANGAVGSGMYQILGIQTAAPIVPEAESVQILGDDILMGEFQFDSVATRQFTVDVAVHDSDFSSRMLGITVETIGETQFSSMDIDGAPEYDMTFIFQSRAKKQDPGTRGKKAWTGVIVLLANAKYLGRVQYQQRAAAAFRYSVTPQLASYKPTGVTLSAAVDGSTAVRYKMFESDNPITMHRHQGTGAVTLFNLDWKPVSAAKTAAIVQRVATTVSSVSTTVPYSVSVTPAPAASAELISVYEFQA